MFGKMDGSRVHSDVRKTKKKQVKDEMDRIRQAEKKRRRLEKALATSAAIRSELEKKKQKKKEEQQRLDEEGAAIAEAVALHVLLDEDSDDSRNNILNKNEGLNSWGDNYGGLHPYNGISRYWVDGVGWVSNPNHQYESQMGFNDIGLMVSSESVGRRDGHPRYLAEERWNDDAGISIAAQAIASLSICDNNEIERYVEMKKFSFFG